jgi:hypothetical protein
VERREAAAFHHANEELHAVKAIHAIVQHTRIVMSILARLFRRDRGSTSTPSRGRSMS